ncbi:fat-like cadherin-related tumor suppressor homolog isoform X2 [Ostrea edulis]|uniref:fat-like cadherin-related tumor suppressor homolog isoform X2 n=1 Tax=Ostrea edulis TaxID=37623 RepID=UPI00209585A3|nr:fat-like cadherin-related tumor suppressor homolog isoform X2 [Ostrea edulis]
MLKTTQRPTLYMQLCFLFLIEQIVASGTNCSSSPCLNNGSCVQSNFRCVCPEDYAGQYCSIRCLPKDPHSAYEGFTSGFLSGMGAMLFLFFSVSCSMYFARKYEVHREERRRKEMVISLRIPEVRDDQ